MESELLSDRSHNNVGEPQFISRDSPRIPRIQDTEGAPQDIVHLTGFTRIPRIQDTEGAPQDAEGLPGYRGKEALQLPCSP